MTEIPEIKPGAIAQAVSERLPNLPHKGRPRWRRLPMTLGGLAIAGVIGWVSLDRDRWRPLWRRTVGAARARLTALRANREGRLGGERADWLDDDAVAFDAAETAPIQPSAFADGAQAGTTAYPPGLGDQAGAARRRRAARSHPTANPDAELGA